MTRVVTALSILLVLLAAWPAVAAEKGDADVQYYVLMLDGKKMGHARTARTVAEGKVTTAHKVAMTVQRAGRSITVKQSETTYETVKGEPLGFETVQDLGMVTQKVTGVVGSDGELTITVQGAGGEQKRTMDWPEGALMSEGVRRLAREKGLKEGLSFKIKVFVASHLRAFPATVEIGPKAEVDLFGRVVELTRVTTDLQMGGSSVPTIAYVNKDLDELKVEMPMFGSKIVMLACPREVALRKNDKIDFFTSDRVVLRSPARLSGYEDASSATFRLRPEEGARLTLLESDAQSVKRHEDGSCTVRVRRVKPGKAQAFPYEGEDKVALGALKPNRILQSEDKRVVALARKAVGDAKDAAEAARRIEKFVRSYVRTKNLQVGYATAAEVAVSRQGDCSEHAVLAAAMCRAVGIPAEVVTGVLYVDRFAGREQIFGPHAWFRVYVGGKWMDLDAAGAGHYHPARIALAAGDGDPAAFMGMAMTLGRFQIIEAEVQE